MTVQNAATTTRAELDDGYPVLEALVRSFGATADTRGPLFTTDAGWTTSVAPRPPEEGGGVEERTSLDLYGIVLANLPADRRQHYNCDHCRRFVDRYGGLVTIDPDGTQAPALWPVDLGGRLGPVFAPAMTTLHDVVRRAKVTGVFLSADAVWGTPFNDPGPGSPHAGRRWTHLSCPNPAPFRHPTLTAAQAAAERAQDFQLLVRALTETPRDAAAEAVRVLDAAALARADKALGMARWFLALKDAWDGAKGRVRTNLLWRAVATAPPGFAHARNGMLGTLFDDLKAGLGYEEVRRRWAAKMNPLVYQRPTALRAGNLEVAEKLIEKLGAAKSLDRRYARLDEVRQHAVWTPATPIVRAPAGGVFGHLRPTAGKAPAEVRPLALPPKTLTWARFRAEVLPTAAKIDYLVPGGLQPFVCLVTAAHADAPPVLQWDGLIVRDETKEVGERESTVRNPVSWYFRWGGAPASQWNLTAGARVAVTAILPAPHEWQRPELFDHFGKSVIFVLAGARDVLPGHKGGGLFPECLRAEFREARTAIEAHARAAEVGGSDEGDANGIAWGRGGDRVWACELRVTDAAGAVADYRVDRWD